MPAATKSQRLLLTAFLILPLLIGLSGSAGALRRRTRRRAKPRPTPSATPSATPTVTMRPIILITGGTGTEDASSNPSPEVLETAEIYDASAGKFFPISPMKIPRD